jgi:hypothetical protein
MHLKSRAVALTLAAIAASACSSDSVIDPSDRPDPPPADAFNADFSFFEARTPEPGGATTSWTQALQTVASARSEMALLAVPEALVRAANGATATRDGPFWLWPFSTTVDDDPYEGQLRSTVVGNQYEWNLFVTAPLHTPVLEDYLWAQGHTLSNGFEGIWSIADAAAGTDSVVARVSWIVNAENSVNFGFSASDSAGWTYERSQGGNVLTYVVFAIPRARVTWFPNGTGRTWTAATASACWDEDLHDIAC